MTDQLNHYTADERKLFDERKQYLKKTINITDEDFEKYISYPAHRKLILRRAELTKYQIIAEVVESKYCSAGLKVGQKYVFNVIPSKLLLDQSTCPFCIKALGPVSSVMNGFWDRLLEGLDPNEGMWQYVRCPDDGVDYGGLGTIIFKVYAQKIA
jgi:uncharacterized repeat protein (TIGR04076 family)